MTEVHVHECLLEEAEDVLALWRQAGVTVSITDTDIDLQRAIGNSTAMVLIAEKDSRIVGSIIGTFDGWRGNIYRLAVHPGHRRQGTASRLLAEVERRLASVGVKRVTALVEKDHPWAMGYWNSTGYELDSRLMRYVRTL